MDNRIVKVASSGIEHLRMAIQLAMRHKCVGYKIVNVNRDRQISEVGTPTIVLYWSVTPGIVAFPYAMSIEQTVAFVHGWLDSLDSKYYYADIDGDTDKGFFAFTDDNWDMVFGQWQAYIAIMPIPAMYGK